MNGDETVPGAALLIAAAPVGKGRLVDAAAALPALAAVRPAVLTGTAGASVVELVEPADPQVVLVRLRTAAAVPGPLLIHLIGQLTVDRKQQLPHVALARTTPGTVRYTALPWHWLTAELQHRAPGTTAVLVDLVADAEAWARLPLSPGLSVAGAALYGAVTPPPGRRGAVAEPLYSRAVAELFRSAAHRPPLPELHQWAVHRAQLPGEVRLLSNGGDLHAARHPAEPMAADTAPLPAVPGPQPGGVPRLADATPASASDQDFPAPSPGTRLPDSGALQGTRAAEPTADRSGAGPVAGSHSPGGGAPHDPVPTDGGVPGSGAHSSMAAPVPGSRAPRGTPPPASGPAARDGALGGTGAEAPETAPGREPAPAPGCPGDTAGDAYPAAAPGASSAPGTADAAAPVGGTDGAGASYRADDRSAGRSRGHAPVPPPRPTHAPGAAPVADDPHPAILAAAREGRHSEASAMAAAWEQHALRHHGPDSAEAVHWLEVRADLARLAGNLSRSCELWMAAASARLGSGEAEDASDVVAAVDRAHHCWEQLGDAAAARGLATQLMALRRRAPGPRPGAVEALERRIETLSTVGAG